ncbi:hypothetical protein JI742_07615 [Piscinibacter sp. Jin2]|uniref:AlpA family phage regulatory protein n=1 Tax=Aquariibacter lacus TaxID=2801332 RepID=A0A9X0XDT1_9BURK|nr:helix-turn-helix domain-containing protein [Piscinibacter lacus]MBL0719754.1 hypothetical protein [Piscinibacter lacus]
MSFNDPLMTKTDVADLMRCCERTLERRVRAGDFPPSVRFGKESLWFQSVVHDWLQRQRAQQQQWLASTQADAGSTAAAQPAPTPALDPKPKADTAQEGPRKSRAKPRPSHLTSRSFFSKQELEAGRA